MIQVQLGEAWKRVGTTRARGYGFHQGRIHDAQELAALLDNCDNEQAWQDAVKQFNGYFAAVTEREGRVWAAVDRLRSIPLFYGQTGAKLYLSDDASWVRDRLSDREIDGLAAAEFLLTGYVTDSDTLSPSVKQLRTGELLSFSADAGGAIECTRYYAFHHNNFIEADTDQLVSRLESVHHNVFERLVKSIDGRPIVIPLSGGYDSRLIGVSLRDAGVRDVTCYNYGVPGNWESGISQELAKYLGFKWVYIPYTAERWKRWAGIDAFHDYFQSAGNLTSVPHVQDWPAIWELRKQGELTPESVIVPGHSGDFLAGSHIPKGYLNQDTVTRRQVLDSIYNAHYTLWDWPPGKRQLKSQLDNRIESVMGGALGDCSVEQAADLYEWWDIQERQAKFICNSLRVYDFFGCDWRLPLFDHELMDFWARIPVHRRYKRTLYFEFVAQRQNLPITDANTDRSELVNGVLSLVEKLGLWSVAKKGQRLMKRVFWEREYNNSPYPPFAWYGMLDRDFFKRTYTGKETMHSYLTRRYLDSVRGTGPNSSE